MRAAFAIAALAGAAIAAPSYGGYGKQEEPKKNVVVVVETVIETCYVTEGYPIPSATPAPEPVPAPAAPTTTVVVEPPKPSSAYVEPPQSTPVYEAPAPSQPAYSAPAYTPAPAPAPAPTPTPTPEPQPAPPADSGYMGVVAEWRAKLGLKELSHDSKLESNAMDTVVSSNGVMTHKLNPGTYGQVLAPGKDGKDDQGNDNFTKVFVGGWLCELPNTPGLDGVCGKMSEGWAYEGQTGHAEILTSAQYSKIGCALHKGIWCCDLA
ncbi:hypothetical protein HBI56_020600 [Parastagonospora nodorum]|uniref:SCP domain-containing protein n=2 Tax=Phaeosphaeria nodorum (strain SN15 / ATCC MYA-4574 / FGSC 10173) TaxID=321614 RepID=A0A7U2F125_PHANO|nr:hypothetical protein SNOG_01331 [Parastagonospora nodorum SN15]KAH3908329.1 hypothetical protein HBH56_173570 [Parastagonospora nodorum]EAT90980.1 hypothetical protein SNOG_01331 [Parastagonospora nodorum SN15]KAH3926302.1 hypothetical protein HBH54_169530 [Parastagonospora nodorum]KAH3955630.1 hypothetical protein HBH53_002150 [Parastagonospora nodorum]KAH3971348.1 hypothetical protein HBH51_111710 [Parastagonospora nodorum]